MKKYEIITNPVFTTILVRGRSSRVRIVLLGLKLSYEARGYKRPKNISIYKLLLLQVERHRVN